jgi:glucosamine-6-phosphate deaminase
VAGVQDEAPRVEAHRRALQRARPQRSALRARPAYQLNIRIFNQLQHTITGWPGGKPDEDDTYRPERARPFPKRCLVLSPEPQDAIVGMGGTIDRLIEQGHDVHLISLTSGSLRVPDSEADKFAGTLLELSSNAAKPDEWKAQVVYGKEALSQLDAKGEFGEDTPVLRQLKGLILRGELRDAAQALGLDHQHVTFLDLPFYEQGRYRRFKSTQADVDALQKTPAGAQAASNLPHGRCRGPEQRFRHHLPPAHQRLAGLHRRGIRQCMQPVALSRQGTCPRSPRDRHGRADEPAANRAQRKRPQSLQRPQQPRKEAPGNEPRKRTNYDSLGLAEYEAIEVFQRWRRV